MQVTRWARTRSCSRSLILVPNSSGSGSPPPSSRAKAEPTTSSRYSSFCERSLDPRRLQRAVWHSRTNSASPKGLRRPSAFRSDLRWGKVRLTFRLQTAPPAKYASMCLRQRKYSQLVSGSGGRRLWPMPLPCPLRTTYLKARFPPEHSP